jgi:RimJ/RimL family protein N-acetyltransferase
VVINLQDADTLWKNFLSAGFETNRLILKPVVSDDFSRLASLLDHGAMYRFLPALKDEKDAQTWLSNVLGKRNYLFLSAKKTADDEMIGFILFNRYPDQRIILGGAISPAHWRCGYASELLLGLKNFLAEGPYPEPVYAEIHRSNTPVRKALLKVGFTEIHHDFSDEPNYEVKEDGALLMLNVSSTFNTEQLKKHVSLL